MLQKDTVFLDSFFCKIVDLGLAYISLRQKPFFSNDDDILVVYCRGWGEGGGKMLGPETIMEPATYLLYLNPFSLFPPPPPPPPQPRGNNKAVLILLTDVCSSDLPPRHPNAFWSSDSESGKRHSRFKTF